MDSHQEDEDSRMAERHQEQAADDKLMEYEMAVAEWVDYHWHNLDKFHDFIFKETDKFEFIPPRVKAYLQEAESEDRLHTNDEFTPRTFAWMLLEFEDLKIMWTKYLQEDFHVDR